MRLTRTVPLAFHCSPSLIYYSKISLNLDEEEDKQLNFYSSSSEKEYIPKFLIITNSFHKNRQHVKREFIKRVNFTYTT